MWITLFKIKNFLLNLFFPAYCLNCQREGEYLCQDCFSLIDISIVFHPQKGTALSGVFSATSYDNFIIKKLISQFKYPPYIKELAKPLASLIITHFQFLEKRLDLSQAILIPIPLTKKGLRARGFNQAEELAKELISFLQIPLISNVLIKIKETLPQVELSGEERKENILGAFSVRNKETIMGKRIFIVDDIFTTGSTMEEAARVLKKAGAKEVWGMVVAK